MLHTSNKAMMLILLLYVLLWATVKACRTPFYPTGILLNYLRPTSVDTVLLTMAGNISSWDPLWFSEYKKATIDLETRSISPGWPAGYNVTWFAALGTHHNFSEYKLTMNSKAGSVSITDTISNESTDLPLPDNQGDRKCTFFWDVLWFVSERTERVYCAYYNKTSCQEVIVAIGPLPGQRGAVTYVKYEPFLESSYYYSYSQDDRIRPIENGQIVWMPTVHCGGSYAYYNESTVDSRPLNEDFFGASVASSDGAYVYKANHTYSPKRAIESYTIEKIHWASNKRDYFPLDAADVLALFDEIDEPTEEPTQEPTQEPTTQEPTEEPTEDPTEEPTVEPTEEPTVEPTEEPTVESTEEPSSVLDRFNRYSICLILALTTAVFVSVYA